MRVLISQVFGLLCVAASSSFAFSPLSTAAGQRGPRLYTASAPSDVEASWTVGEAKSKLLDLAQKFHKEYGTRLFQKGAKTELKKAVEDLESFGAIMDKSDFLGDWTLLVTTVTNREGVDTERFESSLPASLLDPIKKIRSNILDVTNRYLMVQQKVKSTNDDGIVDRIDHTLELEPPKQLRDVLDNLPEQLSNVNINPLSVSKSKIVIVHKAETEDTGDRFKTKISLQSVVLNVAGSSRVLDPNGKDIVGLNIPSLGEFMNTAEFNTTYMDKDLRVSRGKVGSFEQLRVFVRTEPPTVKVDMSEESEDEIVDIESPSDVEDADELSP